MFSSMIRCSTFRSSRSRWSGSYLIVFALVLFGVDLERVDSYFLSAVQEAVGMGDVSFL